MMASTDNLPFLKFAAPGVLKLHPYQPGMPLEELERKLGITNAIKLASNENPIGPSPRVIAALQEALKGNLALYPDDAAFKLKARLAAMHGMTSESITLCNGSNTLLDLLARVFAGPGRAVMYSQYAFAVYPIVTLAQTADAVIVPGLPADCDMPYGDDLDGFAERMRADVSLVFLASPNNPTGTWVSAQALERFLDRVPPQTIVVLDEAYHEFQAPELRPDTRGLQQRHPNLVVTRTFSKAYGLASLRIGYGVSHPAIADLLNRVRQPFNNGTLVLAAAEAALDDQEHVARYVALNERERSRMTAELQAMGLVALPSQANFVAVDFKRDTTPIYQSLLQRGVIVRPMASYEMPTFLRVSIGTEVENARFLEALKDVLGK
jgi:histidinol-phosphate aminotransferase